MNRLSAGCKAVLFLTGILIAVIIIKVPDNRGEISKDIAQTMSEKGRNKETQNYFDNSSISGSKQILSSEEIQQCVKNKSKRKICYGEIRMYDNPAAYDNVIGAFYIPVSIEENEILNNSGVFLSDIQTNDIDKHLFSDPLKAIEEGYLFQALLVEENTYAAFKMVFIGIPTIQLIYDEEPNSSEKHKEKSGTIIVTDPFDNIAQKENCVFHVRGHVTRNYSKKNYRISLKDTQGNKINKAFLGLRSDDDWVLNALYTDQTRLREYVAYQIWKQVNSLCDVPVASSEIAYCALFINGESTGLYGLMVPVDRKLMGMREGDILYKINDWEMPDSNDYKKAEKSDKLTVSGDSLFAEIKYPNNPTEDSWNILHIFQDWAFNEQGDPAPAKISDLERKGCRIDLQNFLTYSLYCILLHAEDNTWKNTYLAAYKQFDGSWFLQRTVWDLNYILGDEFVWNLGQLCTIHVPESSISMKVRKDYPLDFESYQLGNPKATDEILLLWKKWRSNGIEAESVCEMIDRINGTLAASGAYRFEKMCWSLEDPSDSVKNAKDWTKKRFDFLDEVFEYSED